MSEAVQDPRLPLKPRRNIRPVLVAAGAAVLAGAAVAAGSLTGGSTPAFAVARSADGTVTISVSDLAAVHPVNEEMARLGVPIRAVKSTSDCPPGPPVAPATVSFETTDSVKVRLADIPPGHTVLLEVGTFSGGHLLIAGQAGVPVPQCILSGRMQIQPTN